MAACTCVNQHAMLCLCCFPGSEQFIFQTNSLKKLVSVPHQVEDSLNWRKDPDNVYTDVPFIQPSPSISVMTDASLVATCRDSHHSGQMIYPGDTVTPQTPGAEGCQECQYPFPAFNQEQSHKNHDRQCSLHVLYQLASCVCVGRDPLLFVPKE